MSKEDIIRQAMELGQALASSEELEQLKEAQQAVTRDDAAYNTIMQYQHLRNMADSKLRQGIALSSDEEARLEQAEKAVQNDSKIQLLMTSQENFDNLMQSVYFVINQAISGPSCGSGCDSCGGGCC